MQFNLRDLTIAAISVSLFVAIPAAAKEY